jgi:hypothetical protein
MKNNSEFINGICTMVLFSPKGSIEGAMVRHSRKLVQVTVRADLAEALARAAVPGKRLRVLASPDRSPKTKHSLHPVFQVEAMANAAGEAIKLPELAPGHVLINGIVSAVHFARHGEPNGVILENGDFIHLGPPGMEKAGLTHGSAVNAVGELRTTRLGTRLLDAHRVNRIHLT